MDSFQANQAKLHKAFEDSLGANPLAKLAQQNIAMFKAAAAAVMPGIDGTRDTAAAAEAPAAAKDDLGEIRAQMEAMQKKLDALGK